MDHPRLRGEKVEPCPEPLHSLGSPPLTRGKARRSCACCSCSGITPAYAGKRLVHPVFCSRHEDHPRLRGEKEFTMGGIAWTVRITPAYAGKRRPQELRQQQTQDHPRLRGEKVSAPVFATVTLWITPAYAGKRLKKSHKIGLRQFAKRPIPLTSQIRQRSKSNPPRPGAHRKHPSQNVQQASSAYNL